MRTSETSRRNGSTPNAMVGAHAKNNNATCCVPNGVGVLRRAAMSAREVIAPSIWVKESKAWKKSVRHTSALRHAGSVPPGFDDGDCLGSMRSMSKASQRCRTYVGGQKEERHTGVHDRAGPRAGPMREFEFG